jgi:hypothetical protein
MGALGAALVVSEDVLTVRDTVGKTENGNRIAKSAAENQGDYFGAHFVPVDSQACFRLAGNLQGPEPCLALASGFELTRPFGDTRAHTQDL